MIDGMRRPCTLLECFARDECGSTAIEYALIAGIVGIGIVASLGNFTSALNDLYLAVQTATDNAISN